ncbi:MAG: hypothetical protein AABX17_00980 [Nanoarchaeota archaeon]
MVDKRRVFLLGCFLLVVFSVQLVLADSTVTKVHFEQNVTANYDEGVFTINWTAAADAAGNYTIYLWMNNVYISNSQNTSVTNYTRSNTTEANYTFTIQAANATNFKTNYTNISMYVDRTAPLVNWTGSGYNNVTYKKNTDKLTLNISVGDAASGITNSYCIFNISGTNESVAVSSSGWCNTTQLNLTGLADGNHSIDIWANDTVNNVGVNLSYYVVWIDTTAPSAPTFSCTSASLYVAETITCSCSGTDASSGVASTSYTANPSTAAAGTFDTSCTITDNAGNLVSSSISYAVRIRGGSSSSSTFSWTKTYVQDDKEFSEKNQINRDMPTKSRIKIKLNEETHYVGIISLTSTTAIVNVSSVSQQKTMAVGEEWKVETTGDDYYDLLVKLNNIISSKANITISYVHELVGEVPGEDLSQNETTTNGDNVSESENEKQTRNVYYIGGAIILLVIIVFLILKNKRKR